MPAQGRRRGRAGHGRADAATANAIRWCWPPRASPASTACSPSAARRRWARSPTAPRPCPRSTRSSARATPTSPRPSAACSASVGIDMVAGPSEILVICDGRTDPDWIAMDLFSQAEHDELAQAILLSPGRGVPRRASRRASSACCREMPRRDVIATSLAESRRADPRARSRTRPARSPTASRPSTSSCRSPNPTRWLPKIRHAGAMFLGPLHARSRSATTAPGPNHVLPTSRTARFSSPLGVYDFQKRSSADPACRARARRRSAASPRRWRTARACRRTRAPPSTRRCRDERRIANPNADSRRRSAR